VRAFMTRRLHRFSSVFTLRPALRRAGLVFGLYAVLALPMVLLGFLLPAGLWAVFLTALFLGLGAERASLEWDATFALPPVRSFAFWRWQALERKRFLGALAALGLGLVLSIIWGMF